MANLKWKETEKECKHCGSTFLTDRPEQKMFCDRQCVMSYHKLRYPLRKRVMALKGTGIEPKEIMERCNITEKEYEELNTSIQNSVTRLSVSSVFWWDAHLKVDEMQILGKYRLRHEWRLPEPRRIVTGKH